MYAYIREAWRGFFEGVCTPSNATAHLDDPRPSRNAREPEPRQWGSGTTAPLLPHDAIGVLSSSTLRTHTLPCPTTTTLSLIRSGFWSPFR